MQHDTENIKTAGAYLKKDEMSVARTGPQTNGVVLVTGSPHGEDSVAPGAMRQTLSTARNAARQRKDTHTHTYVYY